MKFLSFSLPKDAVTLPKQGYLENFRDHRGSADSGAGVRRCLPKGFNPLARSAAAAAGGVYFFATCVLAAGIWGGVTVSKTIAIVQGGPAALLLIASALAGL